MIGAHPGKTIAISVGLVIVTFIIRAIVKNKNGDPVEKGLLISAVFCSFLLFFLPVLSIVKCHCHSGPRNPTISLPTPSPREQVCTQKIHLKDWHYLDENITPNGYHHNLVQLYYENTAEPEYVKVSNEEHAKIKAQELQEKCIHWQDK